MMMEVEEAGEGKGGGAEWSWSWMGLGLGLGLGSGSLSLGGRTGMNLGRGLLDEGSEVEGSRRLAGVIGGVKGCELRMACLEGGGEARSSELTFGRISISRRASAWYI